MPRFSCLRARTGHRVRMASHDGLRGQFERLYGAILPPMLRDVLAGSERSAFLDARRNRVKVLGERPDVRVAEPPGLWGTSEIEVVMPDLPFIADTTLGLIDSLHLTIRFRVLALFDVHRGPSGRLLDLLEASHVRPPEGYRRESWIYIAVDPIEHPTAKSLHEQLQRNLMHLIRMASDFPAQLQFLSGVQFRSEALQAEQRWLLENALLMGCALWNGRDLAGFLGMLHDKAVRADFTRWLVAHRSEIAPGKGESIRILETDLHSGVHHDRPLHCLSFSSNGSSRIALMSFAGKAEVHARYLIPSLRRRLERIATSLHAPDGSHTRREIFRLAQLIPIGLLLSRPDGMLRSWLTFMLDQRHSRDTARLLLEDTALGGCWIVRSIIGDDTHPAGLNAFITEQKLRVRTEFRRDGDDLSLHFLWLHSDELKGGRIRRLLSDREEFLLLTWTERFRLLAERRITGSNVSGRIRQLMDALDPATSVHISPGQALEALLLIQNLEGDLTARIGATGWERRPALHIYTRRRLLLGDIVPALDSCGLRVDSALQLSYRMPEHEGHEHIFYLADAPDSSLNPQIEQAIRAILLGQTTTDALNRLVIRPGIDVQALRLLKALVASLYQFDRSYSRMFLMDVLISHADLALSIWSLLRLTFLDGKAAAATHRTSALSAIDAILERLHTLPERTTARRLRDLAAAIVRLDLSPDLPWVAFKIQSSLLDFAPVPGPHFEIFVHSPEVEAVHLRAGAVARGGIRWSDRVDDYRQEILGLMATQRLKNTMIVPDGSKGGFVLRRQTSNRSEAGIAAYRQFMRALLRLTDNLDHRNRPTHPAGMVCLDGMDPYLVVAADKGTATFSDTANEIAIEHNFWLGDAFASGGRSGYDHKRQGITARGTWESVRAHFAQIGMDPEKQHIRVIGIGDMSGDVFGNGLLLSRSVQLVAAFNHRFIFLDPNPEPAASYAERKRLFSRGLDWQDYNPLHISNGGGVFERNSADIRLSPAARTMLDIEESTVSGETLVRAILRARADLLWNGGIGTYVKASTERNEDVGDPANDGVRTNGRELRVRVVGEGGNLGFTMQGRYEAAAAGVRLCTDAVDNSGGVDMSDHEVNLKILLQSIGKGMKASGRQAERNQIIRRLEPTMIRQVLENNRSINRCIALEVERFRLQPWLLRLWVQHLLDEKMIFETDLLPGFRETGIELKPPQSNGSVSAEIRLLPFLSNLVGWTKLYYRSRIHLARQASPDFQGLLLSRFRDVHLPGAREAVLAHPLGDSIILTEALNHVVHTAGLTYLFHQSIMHDMTPEEVMERRFRLEHLVGAGELRSSIDGLSIPLPEKIQMHATLERSLLRIAITTGGGTLRTDKGVPLPTAEGSATLLKHLEGLTEAFGKRPSHSGDASLRPSGRHAGRGHAGPDTDDASFTALENAIVQHPCSSTAELRFQGRLLLRLHELSGHSTANRAIGAALERARRGEGLIAVYEALNAR